MNGLLFFHGYAPMPIHSLLVIFLVVIVPIWLILHYGARWRQGRQLTPDSERMLVELADLADRLEARVDNLEKALDMPPAEGRKPS